MTMARDRWLKTYCCSMLLVCLNAFSKRKTTCSSLAIGVENSDFVGDGEECSESEDRLGK